MSGIRSEADVAPGAAPDEGGVLAGGVEDDDLVLREGEDRVEDLALHRERLARARLAADEAHGAREPFAVAYHEVSRLLGLAVVAAALLVELLGGEGHLHRDLPGGEVARDVHVVASQGEHGVERGLLAVVEAHDPERVALGDGCHLLHLAVELLERVRVGVDETGVDEQPLVLVAQEVEELLGLLLGIAQLGREDRVIVALLHRRHLLVDDLLVHPVQLALDHRERVALRDRLDVQRHDERDGQVDDVREVVVLEHRPEIADGEHAAEDAVGLEGVRAPLGREVHEVRRDEVLGPRAAVLGQFVPAELEALLGAHDRVHGAEALLPVEGAGFAAYARQRLAHVRPDARELGGRRVDVVGPDHVGEVAVPLQVGDPLAQLVVEDPVVLVREGVVDLLDVAEEPLGPDHFGGNGGVRYRELHRRVGVEVVVEAREHREDVLLGVPARRLVADVGELDRLAEQALLHLGDAVSVKGVVADVVELALGGVAGLGRPPLLLLPGLRLPSLGLPAAEDEAHEARFPGRRLAARAVPGHGPPPPSSRPCASPCGRACLRRGRWRRSPRTRRPCRRASAGCSWSAPREAGGTPPSSFRRAARSQRARTEGRRP